MTMQKLIDKIDQHLRELAPHVSDRKSAMLLREAFETLKAQQDNAAAGAAIQRAAGELPEGYELCIEIEREGGSVRLYLPDTDASMDDFGGGDTFAEEINEATDYAIRQANAKEHVVALEKAWVAESPVHTCGFCDYEESDGSLIEQCPKCKAADKASNGGEK